jgi:hypothetical protein
VKSKFVEAIQQYQSVEQQYRTKYKQRMERQFKIVKPDATPDEIKAVVNDDGNGQIFQQAVSFVHLDEWLALTSPSLWILGSPLPVRHTVRCKSDTKISSALKRPWQNWPSCSTM